MRASILRTAGSVCLLLFYAWAMFPPPADPTELNEARESTAERIASHPDNVDLLLLVGLSYQREGNFVEARKPLERGVKLAPAYTDFHSALGMVAEAQARMTRVSAPAGTP